MKEGDIEKWINNMNGHESHTLLYLDSRLKKAKEKKEILTASLRDLIIFEKEEK